MRSKLLLFLLLSLTYNSLLFAQQPSRIWASYLGYSTSYPNVNTSSTGYLLVTITSSVYDPKTNSLYITGSTTDSSGIATPGSFKSHFLVTYGNYGSATNYYVRPDLFLARFDTSGHCLWSTYYGGTGDDRSASITVDTNGNIYLCGMTNSDSGIATSGSYLPSFPGTLSGYLTGIPFLVKFDSTGQRQWGTYLGGNPNTNYQLELDGNPIHVACNRQNNKIYVLGTTLNPSGIATPGAFLSTLNPSGNHSLFLCEFNTAGVKQWGTYYGGEKGAYCTYCSLYIDQEQGNIYMLGETTSRTGIATTGAAADTITDTITGNAFLAKFNSSGQRQWATYIPIAQAFSVASDEETNVYVSGVVTPSYDDTAALATPGSYQDTFVGTYRNALLLQYNALNGKKNWSTYYGGGDEYFYNGIPNSGASPFQNLAIDESNKVIMIGSTTSPQHVEKGCHPYPVNNPLQRIGFVTQWDNNGNLICGSYYNAGLSAVTIGGNGSFYLVGVTNFDSLSTPGVAQTNKIPGKPAGYIARLSENMHCPPEHFQITQQNQHLSVDSGHQGYQWFQNSMPIAGANQSGFTVTDSGSYYVLISDSCGCSYRSDTVHVSTTGITDINAGDLNLSLSPNPNNGQFLLSGNLTNNGRINRMVCQLTDITGRVLKNISFDVHQNYFKKSFNFSCLETGVYFLKITSDSGSKAIQFKTVAQ